MSVTRGVGKMQVRLRVASSLSLLIAAWVLITRSSKSLKAGDLTNGKISRTNPNSQASSTASLSNILKRPSQTSPASQTRLDRPSIVHKHPPTPRQHLTRPSNVTRAPQSPHKNPRTFPKPQKPRTSNPPMALVPTATSAPSRPPPRLSGLPIIHSRMRRASAPAKAALGTL